MIFETEECRTTRNVCASFNLKIVSLIEKACPENIDAGTILVDVIVQYEIVVFSARNKPLLLQYLIALLVPPLNVKLRAVLALAVVDATDARFFPEENQAVVLSFEVGLDNFVNAVVKLNC